jgi:hypothetical protein
LGREAREAGRPGGVVGIASVTAAALLFGVFAGAAKQALL